MGVCLLPLILLSLTPFLSVLILYSLTPSLALVISYSLTPHWIHTLNTAVKWIKASHNCNTKIYSFILVFETLLLSIMT